MYRRWPSAKRVSKASELLPDPLKPVMTISWLSGKSRSKFFRLLCRRPRRRITDRADDFNICYAKISSTMSGVQILARWHGVYPAARQEPAWLRGKGPSGSRGAAGVAAKRSYTKRLEGPEGRSDR